MTKLFALLAAIGVAFAAPAFAVEAQKDQAVEKPAKVEAKDAKDANIAPAAGEASEGKEEMKEEMKK